MQGNAQPLISKRELLEKYEISYGALYRWKRKGLIPEDWFIKKSTSTGQETFFPRELIVARVERILSRSEEELLDELAEKLSRTEKEDDWLLLDTAFGEKTFRLQDIRRIRFRAADGSETDLTELLTRQLTKEE